MDEKHCSDLLAGFALGALEGEDRSTAERHIMNCPECQIECQELQEVLHWCFGHAVPPAKPSPLVRVQFLAQLALEMGPAQADTVPGRPAPPRPPMITLEQTTVRRPDPTAGSLALVERQRYWWLLGGAALPAALALVFGMLFMHSQNQLNDTRDRTIADALTIPHVTMPMSGIAVSHGMRGEVIMPQSGNSGLVIVSGINKVPTGMRFTCWIREQGRWTASGTLQPDASGIAMLVFGPKMNLHQADDVAVTMERAPRPSQPSGPMLLSSTL
jgi:anti-sigma-K factor RskA